MFRKALILAGICVAGSSGCIVDRFATREVRVIEPSLRGQDAVTIHYSAVPEQYIRQVEKIGEDGQPLTVLYLQTPVKVTLVPVNKSLRTTPAADGEAE